MGWKASIYRALERTRQCFRSGGGTPHAESKEAEPFWRAWESHLLRADLGPTLTSALLSELQREFPGTQAPDPQAWKTQLKAKLREKLPPASHWEERLSLGDPTQVVLLVGVNGSGKTTSLGKLAWRLKHKGIATSLAAGDTFRTAATEQLVAWGEKSGIKTHIKPGCPDPAALLFEALSSARRHQDLVLLADTAGRLQQPSLRDELKKVARVLKRVDPQAPHERWLVLDASQGQNAYSQVVWFHEAIGLTGLILTKLDGTAKGGAIFSLSSVCPCPIQYIGVGENVDDLLVFDPESYLQGFLEN